MPHRSVSPIVESGRITNMAEQDNNKRAMPLPLLGVITVALLVALIFLGQFCSTAATIDVTINNTPLTLHGTKTLDAAIRKSGLPVNPGDFISLRGNVLERDAGDPFFATVNGEETADPNRELHDGDEITVTDGKDIVEDYDVDTEALPFEATVTGAGALCTFEAGEEGTLEHRTGLVSGEETRMITNEAKNSVANWHIPDVGDDKVIALTFDEGPSSAYTSEILDVLAENDVQATFFCQGDQIGKNIDLVKREWGTYNQVASNTYTGKVTKETTADDLRAEVENSFKAISEALEGESTSRTIRFPEALLTRDMAAVISDDVDAVVGWDIDTGDWLGHSADDVYDVIMSAQPGNILVLHDGSDQSWGTANALRRAIPDLKEQGYSFVTIDRLLMYPAKEIEE